MKTKFYALYFILVLCMGHFTQAQKVAKPSFNIRLGNTLMDFTLDDPGGLMLFSIPQAESIELSAQIPVFGIKTYIEPTIGYKKVGIQYSINSGDFDTIKPKAFFPTLNTNFGLKISRYIGFLEDKILFNYGLGIGVLYNTEPNIGTGGLKFKSSGYLTLANKDTTDKRAVKYTYYTQSALWNPYLQAQASLHVRVGKSTYLTFNAAKVFTRREQLLAEFEYSPSNTGTSRINKARLESKGGFVDASLGLQLMF